MRPPVSVALARLRRGATRREDVEEVIEDVGTRSRTIALARSSLADARVDLDDAVSALSSTNAETVVAPPDLMGLLCRVVAARRHLEDVEGLQNAGVPASFR